MGKIVYRIVYQEHVIHKHIPKIPKNFQILIRKAIENKLVCDPISFGAPLRHSMHGHRKIRIGDYRVVYRIENTQVIIIAIMHRKEVYKHKK